MRKLFINKHYKNLKKWINYKSLKFVLAIIIWIYLNGGGGAVTYFLSRLKYHPQNLLPSASNLNKKIGLLCCFFWDASHLYKCVLFFASFDYFLSNPVPYNAVVTLVLPLSTGHWFLPYIPTGDVRLNIHLISNG